MGKSSRREFLTTAPALAVSSRVPGLDGGMVAVLANRGPERRVQLLLGAKALDLELAADWVTTLEWA